MQNIEYSEIAEIHLTCLEQSFLSTLGVRFLALLYESIDADPHSVLFVERSQGRIIGFVTGGYGMRSVYKQLLVRFPRLVLAIFPVLFDVRKILRIFELLTFRRASTGSEIGTKAELLSIAVKPEFRGTSVAVRLYCELAKYFASQGETSFNIVVGEALERAHRFYTRMGAVPIARISVHKGHWSKLYCQSLPILQ